MKSRVALAVAIVLALLAAIGIKFQMSKQAKMRTEQSQEANVVVAAKRIEKNTVITGDMLGVQSKVLMSEMFTDNLANRIVGQRATVPIEEGAAILASQLGSRSSDTLNIGESLKIGYELKTVAVDKVSGLAGQLVPGSVVDVLVTSRVRGTENAPVMSETRVLLRGIYVYSVDGYTERGQMTDRERRDFANYSTVTLRVLPLQGMLLTNQQKEGSIDLVLRNPADLTGLNPLDLGKINPTNLEDMIRRANEEKPPAPAAPAAPAPAPR